MNVVSPNLPVWLRIVLLAGVVGLVSGASLLAYRYYTRPVTLSVAVGAGTVCFTALERCVAAIEQRSHVVVSVFRSSAEVP